MTRIDPPTWLGRGPAARVLALLDADGEEARVVGGAVRSAMRGEAPSDVDIATTTLPEETTRRAEAAGLKVALTGFDHGTVTIVVDGVGVEATTLREDIETDGRRAVVRYGRDWLEDAKRRDFTFNALTLTRTGELWDPFGGLADLEAGRVRFIGDPARRIAEDSLRALRFFRFHARLGIGTIDRPGLAAAIAARATLADLSRERVRAELMKTLLAPRAAAALNDMADCGILGDLLGGVPTVATLERLAAVEAGLGLEPDAARRLAALAVMTREDAERLRERLRLSNEEFRRLDGVGAGWWTLSPAMGETATRSALYLSGPRGFRDRALLAWARSGAATDDPTWRTLATLPDRWTAPAFPIGGDTLRAAGVEAGPAIGLALAKARTLWLERGMPTDSARVAAIVEAARVRH